MIEQRNDGRFVEELGAIPGAELRVLDGCGHWATIERAKQVNYAMTLFYSRQRSSQAA
ncbi:alpha/beta fold hydrolase [Acidisoma sp. S159]|jgi:3-oxoadipate enol-lactonase|uniref:alpha/beta fold hydrolase n=1 Tax=Acidisoma sp. S159 TaxID=1747225 RepID=UPI00131C76BF|nr:hypothetical protein [Acidisoma sp. S159]